MRRISSASSSGICWADAVENGRRGLTHAQRCSLWVIADFIKQQTQTRLAQFTRRVCELTAGDAFETLRLHAADAVGI